MLNKEQKKQLVKDLTEKMKDSKSIVFTDFTGINVQDISALKKELRQEECSYQVLKKTLMQIALSEAGIKGIDVRNMEGQIALSISQKDEVAPAKVLSKFAKQNENLKILAGVVENKEFSQEEVMALAKLPSREELLAKIVGSLKAPMSGMVNVLGGNMRGLVYTLKSIAESK